MKHSIIIPLYNKADYVACAINSVFDQERPPHELIVVDDCSSDGSPDLARRLARAREKRSPIVARFIQIKENRGPSYARNRGLEAARGEIISFLDADDYYHPQFCARVFGCMDRHGANLTVVGIRKLDTNITRPLLEPLKSMLAAVDIDVNRLDDVLGAVTSPHFFLGPESAACRRELLEGIVFDEDCRMYEGIDFWYRVVCRALDEGYLRAYLLEGALVFSENLAGSLSRHAYEKAHSIQEPPLLSRLAASGDPFDRRLRRVICRRWLVNTWRRLGSRRQKALFLWRFRRRILEHPTGLWS